MSWLLSQDKRKLRRVHLCASSFSALSHLKDAPSQRNSLEKLEEVACAAQFSVYLPGSRTFAPS